VTIAGPTSIAHGTTGDWTASVQDPFAGGNLSYSYSWNWGDGTAPTVTTTGSATHDYAAAGSYTITLTVTDHYGQKGAGTYHVTVT